MTKRQTAAVVGAGMSGLAAAEALDRDGFRTTVYDQNPQAKIETDRPIRLRVDENADALADAIVDDHPDLVVLSPGVPPHSALAARPVAAGLEVIGEVELAWRAGKTTEWLCITGTNGKTTTVEMLASILRAAGHNVEAAGNVGRPLTEKVVASPPILPVELSSAQLATTTTLAPWASICLNIDSDHLDWHGSEEAYWAAKASVYDRTVKARFYFVDEPETKAMAEQARGAGESALVPITFGRPVEKGLGVYGGELVVDCESLEPKEQRMDLTQIPLLQLGLRKEDGQNSPLVRDAVAAAALAVAAGISLEDVAQGLVEFEPQPHRFKPIGHHMGRHWVDDSKATNPHAARVALNAVSTPETVWVVGGYTKGNDLSDLVTEMGQDLRGAVIIGAEQAALTEAFAQGAPQVPVINVPGDGPVEQWMDEVVRACHQLSRPDDTVLLAPASASWDQFESYAQRGDAFTQAVLRSAESAKTR